MGRQVGEIGYTSEGDGVRSSYPMVRDSSTEQSPAPADIRWAGDDIRFEQLSFPKGEGGMSARDVAIRIDTENDLSAQKLGQSGIEGVPLEGIPLEAEAAVSQHAKCNEHHNQSAPGQATLRTVTPRSREQHFEELQDLPLSRERSV